MIKLSKRLSAIADYVNNGAAIADIGTDHGFLPIYLAQKSIIKSAIAMDVRKGPLSRASLHIQEEGLNDYIKTRLSDGMKELAKGEADTVIIAGLGGNLMIDILKDAKHLRPFIENYILSPHSEWETVRRYLLENSYEIIAEDMIKDEGKYYIILKVINSDKSNSYTKEIYYKFGYFLIKNKSDILLEYLDKEYNKYSEIFELLDKSENNESIIKRKEEVKHYIGFILEAKDEMQGVTL